MGEEPRVRFRIIGRSAINGEVFAKAVRHSKTSTPNFKLGAMNAAANDGELDEASLVKLYMELTGANESSARSVYMFVNRKEDEEEHKTDGLEKWRTEKGAQPFVAKSSPVCTESDEELGIGSLGRDGLAFAGK
jgi:hypothetical protein